MQLRVAQYHIIITTYVIIQHCTYLYLIVRNNLDIDKYLLLFQLVHVHNIIELNRNKKIFM